jgi:hypothetical protein
MDGIYQQVNWNPDNKTLRQFSWAVAGALTVPGIILGWRAHGVGAISVLLWTTAALLLTAACFAPRSLLWVYRVWQAVTVPIGAAVQVAMLCVFYYLVLTPVGIVLRCLGRDPLQRRWDAAASSYWIACTARRDPRRYFHPY